MPDCSNRALARHHRLICFSARGSTVLIPPQTLKREIVTSVLQRKSDYETKLYSAGS